MMNEEPFDLKWTGIIITIYMNEIPHKRFTVILVSKEVKSCTIRLNA